MPAPKPFPILTIGLAKTTPAALAAIAKSLKATILDVRGRPIDRRRGYGKLQLADALRDDEERYVWVGDRLGGLNHGGSREGWMRFLPDILRVYPRPIFMCACDGPGRCHRHQITLMALNMGPRRRAAYHLLGNELINAYDVELVMRDTITEYEADLWDSPAELAKLINRYWRS